jgi:hypothetical protein
VLLAAQNNPGHKKHHENNVNYRNITWLDSGKVGGGPVPISTKLWVRAAAPHCESGRENFSDGGVAAVGDQKVAWNVLLGCGSVRLPD